MQLQTRVSEMHRFKGCCEGYVCWALPRGSQQGVSCLQISVNRSNQYASALAKHGPTGSAYVTFKRPEDALRCIKVLDGGLWKGKPIKACFGTTKYCNAFLKGLTCNNPDCLYLHELGESGGEGLPS